MKAFLVHPSFNEFIHRQFISQLHVNCNLSQEPEHESEEKKGHNSPFPSERSVNKEKKMKGRILILYLPTCEGGREREITLRKIQKYRLRTILHQQHFWELQFSTSI